MLSSLSERAIMFSDDEKPNFLFKKTEMINIDFNKNLFGQWMPNVSFRIETANFTINIGLLSKMFKI